MPKPHEVLMDYRFSIMDRIKTKKEILEIEKGDERHLIKRRRMCDGRGWH